MKFNSAHLLQIFTIVVYYVRLYCSKSLGHLKLTPQDVIQPQLYLTPIVNACTQTLTKTVLRCKYVYIKRQTNKHLKEKTTHKS